MSIVSHDADNTHNAIIEGLAKELGWECFSNWAEGEDLGWGDGSGTHCWVKDNHRASVKIVGESIILTFNSLKTYHSQSDSSEHTMALDNGSVFSGSVTRSGRRLKDTLHYTLNFELCDPDLIEAMRERLECMKWITSIL